MSDCFIAIGPTITHLIVERKIGLFIKIKNKVRFIYKTNKFIFLTENFKIEKNKKICRCVSLGIPDKRFAFE